MIPLPTKDDSLTELRELVRQIELEDQKKMAELKAKALKRKLTLNKKIRKAREHAIMQKGSTLDKLGLLEVDIAVLLGRLAQAKPNLLNPNCDNYIEWELIGRELYEKSTKTQSDMEGSR